MIDTPDDLVTLSEQRLLVRDWDQTGASFPEICCLHEFFALQAERTPRAIAIQEGERTLSYQQLDRRANQLARHLHQRGVGPDIPVGLCLSRSLEQLVGLLAILKAGGAYIPLDPALPPERLRYLIADAGLALILTQEAHSALLTECEWLSVPRIDGLMEDASQASLVGQMSPLNLAYVIYTSGSTGQPKGVLVSHRNVINHSTAIARHYRLAPEDRVLQFSSLSFDAAVEEIFPTWLSGAALVLRPPALLTFEQFHTLIEQERLTVLDLPTAYWHAWVQELERHPRPLPDCLRLVIIGGEKADEARWRLWQELSGNKLLLSNTYGPTETTVTATLYDALESFTVEESAGTLPIGQPLANVRCYVLDCHLQPLPVEVCGELYLGGEGVARGYLNRPALTAERFLPDPFVGTSLSVSSPGTRMYRTGDRVYRRADGQIVYVEREDRQVKVRGYRIELGEIEQALRKQPAIQEAVVLLREDQPGKPQLVAYVQPVANALPDLSLLRLALKQQLPAYMLPAAIVPLPTLPLTLSGKIDRNQLPAPALPPRQATQPMQKHHHARELQVLKQLARKRRE